MWESALRICVRELAVTTIEGSWISLVLPDEGRFAPAGVPQREVESLGSIKVECGQGSRAVVVRPPNATIVSTHTVWLSPAVQEPSPHPAHDATSSR